MHARLFRLHPMTVVKLSRLQKEAEQDGAYRVAKRLHAVLLCAKGHTSGHIAELLRAPRSKVSVWLQQYEASGIEGLLEGQRTGRPAGLSEADRTHLADLIDSGPVAYGFLGGVWTSPMVSRVIKEEFGRVYHPGHVRRLLEQWGFSVQRPKRQLAKANPDLLARWRRVTYPAIKKKPVSKVRPSSSKMKPASGKTPPSTKPGPGSGISRSFRSPVSGRASKSLGRSRFSRPAFIIDAPPY